MKKPDRLCRALCMCAVLAATPAALWAAPSLPDDFLGTDWYTVTILGQRSGWSEQSLQRSAGGLQTTEHTMLRVSLDGTVLTTSRTETRSYDAQWRFVSLEHTADQVGRPVRVVARREDDKLLVTKHTPDGETRQELTLPPDFGQDLHVLQAILDKQLQPGWQHTFTTFDCDLDRLDQITLRVLERTTGERPAWVLEARSQLLDVPSRVWVDDRGTILRQEVPGMMGMTLELATEAEALAELQPFLLSSAVAVDREMGPTAKLTQVRLEVRSDGAAPERVFAAIGRQSVTREGDAAVVTVRAETAPEQSVPLPITDAALQLFLAPADPGATGDEQMRQQARKIIGDERDAWAAARKLMHWVHRQMTKVDSEPRPLSALEILQAMRGDCTEHTILLAALCQSVGIPARMAAGLVYDQRAYHYHAWSDVYVGRWVEMDATWGQEVVDAGHVQIAAAALDSTSMARLSLASSQSMGRLKLRVLDFQATP